MSFFYKNLTAFALIVNELCMSYISREVFYLAGGNFYKKEFASKLCADAWPLCGIIPLKRHVHPAELFYSIGHNFLLDKKESRLRDSPPIE